MREFTLLNRALEESSESGVIYIAEWKNVRRKLKGNLSGAYSGAKAQHSTTHNGTAESVPLQSVLPITETNE
jgi:hypothetical protein